MSATVRGTAGNTFGLTQTITVAKPTGTAPGDVLGVAITLSNRTPGTFTLGNSGYSFPSGISSLIQSTANAMLVMVRDVGSNEASSDTFTWQNSSSGSWASFAVSKTGGIVTSAPGSGAASLSHSAPSLTPTDEGQTLVCCYGSNNLAGTTFVYSPDPTLTEVGEYNDVSIAATEISWAVQPVGITSTGVKVATITPTAVEYCSASLLFKPVEAAYLDTDGFWKPFKKVTIV